MEISRPEMWLGVMAGFRDLTQLESVLRSLAPVATGCWTDVNDMVMEWSHVGV